MKVKECDVFYDSKNHKAFERTLSCQKKYN